MTFKAAGTAVLVAVDATVFVIHLGTRMTGSCAGKYLILSRRRVALLATGPFVPVLARVNAEVLRIMIECRGPPRRCRVAGRAVMTELQRHMIGVLRLGKLHRMTLVAILINEVIVVVRVARLTINGDVPPRERKIAGIVIERGRPPCPCRVAVGTILTEVSRTMIGICGAVVVCEMAADTRRWKSLILVVDVTLVA